MEYYNNILTISHAEITAGIVSKDNYKKLTTRGKIQVVRRGCYGTPALIAFDSLPAQIKNACIDKYGDPREHAVESAFTSYIEDDYNAYSFFSSFTLDDGRFLPEEVQKRYIANAKVLNAIRRVVNDRKAIIKALGGTVNVWPNIAKVVHLLEVQYGHDLPENYRRLQDVYKRYVSNGYISLVSGKFMNKNAIKVKDEQQEALLRQLFRKHNNLDNAQIESLYNIVAENTGWDKITGSTVANYREKWDLQTTGGRRGETDFDNTKAMLVKRKAPVLPLVYWTADGWDAELLYQKTTVNKDGNQVTTYHNRLTIVVVLDPCCKYPVGYAIGEQESPALIREAFRNAVNHTAELFGQRHRVHQLQTDNYSKKNLLPMYEGLSEYFTPARVHNAKSKVIEPYFKYLNKKYCQMMPNWSGFGVTAKKDSQPNAQYLNKIRHSFPDIDGVVSQLERIIELERATKRDKYIAAYSELPADDRLLMSNQDFLYFLGEETGYTNRLSASGLVVKINGEKKMFDTFDVRFREHGSEDWIVKFDPSNTYSILAINKDATFRFELTEKYDQPMALYDRKEGDSEQLAIVSGFNKALKNDILDGMKQDQQLVDNLFNENPKLSDTLTKLILVDSNGQHKDQKSAARLAGAQKILEKQNRKETKEQEKSWQQEQEEYLSNKVDLNKYL